MVDRDRIDHVFDNLIGNAIQHTPRGGSIRLTARPEGDAVQVDVRDTGEGIPREHLPRLFEKFYRIPGASPAGGAGLGLAIVREIITAHGGRIDVASQPGKGTTFTFTLPACHDAHDQAPTEGHLAMYPPKCILIVDDEPNVRLMLRTALESAGYRVVEAADGLAALTRLRDAACDLVLLDLRMPKLDGIATLHRLRERGDATPVVMLTAHGSIPDAVDRDEAGRDRLPRPSRSRPRPCGGGRRGHPPQRGPAGRRPQVPSAARRRIPGRSASSWPGPSAPSTAASSRRPNACSARSSARIRDSTRGPRAPRPAPHPQGTRRRGSVPHPPRVVPRR